MELKFNALVGKNQTHVCRETAAVLLYLSHQCSHLQYLIEQVS